MAHILQPRAAKQGKDKFAEIPTQPKKRLELVSRLSAWTRRFMERGPAQAVSGTAGLAFGMLTRPNPWRLAPDKDGRLSIMLAEKDRWGKTRKYAVRPFGRYENLVLAEKAHVASEASKQGQAPGPGLAQPAFADSFDKAEIDDAQKVAGVLYKYFADAVVERTEPLAAPVILATRRNDTADADGLRRPGETVQIIVSRHPEEIVSDANIRVDAGLAIRHVAVGFWREFAAPQWAGKVVELAKVPKPIDLLAEFGPFRAGQHDYRQLPAPRALSIVKEPDKTAVPPIQINPIDDINIGTIRELYERHPDLWRGAYALNLAAMPYGFRLHATAHVAAGVVVSPPSVATIDEAGYRLVLPWQVKIPAPKTWQDQPVSAPLWNIDRPAAGDIDKPVKVVVRWPLVRIVDGMFEDARAIWFQAEDAPDLYRLPDPAVSYRLSIETRDGRVRVGEVDVGAVTNDPDSATAPRTALYLNQLIGARFTKPDNEPIPSVLAARLPTHFELALTLTVKGDAPPASSEPASFAPRPTDPLPQPGDLRVAAADIAVWGEIAPLLDGIERKIVLTVTPPDVPDPAPPVPPAPPAPPDPKWTAFKKAVEKFVAEIETYAALAAPKAVKESAAMVASKVKPFAVDRVADWPGTTSGGKAQPATLELPWVLGLPAEGFDAISVDDPKGWGWPTKPPATATNAAARGAVGKLLDDAIGAAGGNAARVDRLKVLKRTVIDAMRARTVAWRRFHDEKPVHKLMPLRRRDLPGPITVSVLPSIAATDPVDLLATVSLPAKAGRTEADVEAAIAALEGTINTADTLETLATLARQPTAAADIAMRWSSQATVMPRLKGLSDGAALDPKITTMIVIKPALSSESATFAPASGGLPAIAEELSQEMLFGPKRRLMIQAFHGLAKPADSMVEKDTSK